MSLRVKAFGGDQFDWDKCLHNLVADEFATKDKGSCTFSRLNKSLRLQDFRGDAAILKKLVDRISIVAEEVSTCRISGLGIAYALTTVERKLARASRIDPPDAHFVNQDLSCRMRSSIQPVVSVPDSFAPALAQEREWTLLTGDGQMRELARQEQVTCHGVLWLLDQMEDTGTPALLLLL